MLLPKPEATEDDNNVKSSPTGELIKSVKLFKTKEMLLLSVTFLYTGK